MRRMLPLTVAFGGGLASGIWLIVRMVEFYGVEDEAIALVKKIGQRQTASRRAARGWPENGEPYSPRSEAKRRHPSWPADAS